jgi:hypothetical protein
MTGSDAVVGWVDWLRRVWGIEAARDAISQASPVLTDRVHGLLAAEVPDEREARRVVLSVVRYVARLTGRTTPNGMFAGVTAAPFASRPAQRSGDTHRIVARADARWLAQVISDLERRPDVLAQLRVVVNTTLLVRGERLVVPYQPNTNNRGTGAVELALRYTGPVRAVVNAAREPMRFDDVRRKILTEFPRACSDDVTGLLTTLVTCRVLVTSLHAPSTEPDASGHLLRELGEVDEAAAEQYTALSGIHALLQRHSHGLVEARRALRVEAADRMGASLLRSGIRSRSTCGWMPTLFYLRRSDGKPNAPRCCWHA